MPDESCARIIHPLFEPDWWYVVNFSLGTASRAGEIRSGSGVGSAAQVGGFDVDDGDISHSGRRLAGWSAMWSNTARHKFCQAMSSLGRRWELV